MSAKLADLLARRSRWNGKRAMALGTHILDGPLTGRAGRSFPVSLGPHVSIPRCG